MNDNLLVAYILESSETGLEEALKTLDEECFTAFQPSNLDWSNKEGYNLALELVSENDLRPYIDIELEGGTVVKSFEPRKITLETDNYTFIYEDVDSYPESQAVVGRAATAFPNKVEEALLRYTLDNYRPVNRNSID